MALMRRNTSVNMVKLLPGKQLSKRLINSSFGNLVEQRAIRTAGDFVKGIFMRIWNSSRNTIGMATLQILIWKPTAKHAPLILSAI